MVNMCVLVGEAISMISAGRLAGAERVRRTEELLRPAGKALRVAETQPDAGSGAGGGGRELGAQG
jgi:pyrroline-5-carboxylate reductase